MDHWNNTHVSFEGSIKWPEEWKLHERAYNIDGMGMRKNKTENNETKEYKKHELQSTYSHKLKTTEWSAEANERKKYTFPKKSSSCMY